MNTQLQNPVMVRSNGQQDAVALDIDLARTNPIWLEGALFNFLVSGEDSQGKVAVVEAIQRKGYEPLHHRHPATDVTYYVSQGEMTFYVDGQTVAAPAGTNVFISRGKEYTFTVETPDADTLIIFTPAATIDAFKEMSAPVWK